VNVRAIVQRGYGLPERVLELRDDVPKPPVSDDGVLVKVNAASVNAGDWRTIFARPAFIRLTTGVRRPRSNAVGVDAAGVAEAVGKDVSHVVPGDEVFGMRNGAFADYVSGKSFVRKPANLSFAEAAAVPAAGCTALQAVRDHGRIKAGERVLVNGAGGGVGIYAVQLAKAFGADVTAVTRGECLEMVRDIGADRVIDYGSEDFTRSSERYDLIVDCGGKPSVPAFRRVLAPTGRLVLVAAGKGPLGVLGRLVGSQVRARLLGQPVINFIAKAPFVENLDTLRQLIEEGKVRPVIERTYPLEQAAEAISYLETERARGKVVITVAEDA